MINLDNREHILSLSCSTWLTISKAFHAFQAASHVQTACTDHTEASDRTDILNGLNVVSFPWPPLQLVYNTAPV